MPSGAAQSAVLLSSILYIESRSKTWKAIAIIFGTFLCFSRIYLGVHYISDVIVGAFIGALLATVYYKLLPLFERKGKKFMLAFPLLLFLIGGPFALLFVSFTLGMQLGLIANADKNRTPLSKNLRLLETAIVLIGLFTLAGFAIKAPALQLIFGLVMGTWLSYLGPQTFAFIAKKSGKVI
jgi:hypothetical protein